MGDLTHDTITLVSDTIPINIGFIGAYAKGIFGEAIEIELFKYPQSLIDAMKVSPPDVLALSNYSWNSHLSEWMAGFGKKLNPEMITVQGGTNFPHRAELQLNFLLTRPNTDIFVELEGEISFSNVIRRVLEARENNSLVLDEPMSGCLFVHPRSKGTSQPELIRGGIPNRLKDLNEIPSPYLNGMLDKFFDGRLTPFLETNRGCPFTCSFCHTGNEYYNKVNQFPLERVEAEILYIAPKMQALGIKNLHIADTNFGMYARDSKICSIFYETIQKYGWPMHIMATTGKNSKERIIEATEILGNTFSVNMSVQSMDEGVLKNIKRSNIKLDHYVEINKVLNEKGRSTKGELIIGLPGETRQSFVTGLQNILNAGVSLVCSYSLMLLHGTQFQEPDYRKQFGIKGKYRVVPLNFGEYEGEMVFDYEETGIENKDMSFDDYLWLRGLSLMVELIHNSRPFHELFMYVTPYQISVFDFVMKLYNSIGSSPQKVRDLFGSFDSETRNELWDTEAELVAFYKNSENYEKLKRGDLGGNVIYKHKAMGLAYCPDDLIEFLSSVCLEIVKEKDPSKVEQARGEIKQLGDFVKNHLNGVLQNKADTSPRSMTCDYDILGWKNTFGKRRLEEFKLDSPIRYNFVYTQEQIDVRNDHFKRYGVDYNALSKIVTRVSNLENLFRRVSVEGIDKVDEANGTEQFVRYTLSN
jgi:radical SAM superfamily enzyme YgiQ (UPF0313 family)